MSNQAGLQDVVAAKRDPFPAARRRIIGQTTRLTMYSKGKPYWKYNYTLPEEQTHRYRIKVTTKYIITLYIDQHLTLEEIGRVVGMSKQGILRRLQKAGITREQGTWITRPCAYCGVDVRRQRQRVHRTSSWYCCAEHYYAARENPDFQPWHHGGRLARAVVAQHYPLAPTEIVHHKDTNVKNNDISNLAVFASQSDHLAYHHGRKIDPVWDGASVTR